MDERAGGGAGREMRDVEQGFSSARRASPMLPTDRVAAESKQWGGREGPTHQQKPQRTAQSEAQAQTPAARETDARGDGGGDAGDVDGGEMAERDASGMRDGRARERPIFCCLALPAPHRSSSKQAALKTRPGCVGLPRTLQRDQGSRFLGSAPRSPDRRDKAVQASRSARGRRMLHATSSTFIYLCRRPLACGL